MIVCIAEKPNVAGQIAKVLGANTRRNGYWEGNGYQVTWAIGHLLHIKEPQGINKDWEIWSLHNLPMLPDKYEIELDPDKGKSAQFNLNYSY